MTKVYVSLTTIPSRDKILRKCLDSLINQMYPITKIILTIPQRTLRGNKKTYVPNYLYEQPYSDKVIVTRPRRDYGPIMKYIGCYKEISKNSVVFVCDDDQQYDKYLIERLVDRYDRLEPWEQNKTVITASGTRLICTDVVYGHGSLLVPHDTIQLIRHKVINANSYVRKSCQLVDDNWVSIILKRNGIRVINMGYEEERYVEGEPINPSDGLSKTTDRCMDIMKCTYAIDHENTYPVVAIIMFLLFIIVILVNHYYMSYY